MLEDNNPPFAVIYGCSGTVLTDAEKAFFADVRPAGFILFGRNCLDPDQVVALVTELKNISGQAETPILIDQEGGRVQRLGRPHWPDRPAAAVFRNLAAHDLPSATAAARLNAELIAADLAALGINVNCAPVLDVPAAGAHEIIGDRAYGDDPDTVAALGLAVCEGFFSRGIMPVIKHIPGHGRAGADSHLELPIVDAAAGDLSTIDFRPFQALSRMPFFTPWAMTAHVVYTALDPDRPATTSTTVIKDIIRGTIGFDGVLVSDDIGMKALGGPFAGRATQSLAAGCDLVLHCSGEMAEMEDVAKGLRPITSEASARLARGGAMLGGGGDWDKGAAQARLDEILATGRAG
ncbi:MAG: beta-N-acetylhexosaminidase [Proteobacteria bacterium]|nr:beta-N-acetylhexosaminidase [Pseudomonadota bacterium]